MSLNPKATVASRNLALDAVLDQLNNGFLRVYDGTQPADADTAITTQVMLAQLTFGATAWAAASGASKTANAITTGVAAATGTATWYRLFKSDGTTAVADGSVGTATSNLVLNTVSIVTSADVSVTSFVYTMGA